MCLSVKLYILQNKVDIEFLTKEKTQFSFLIKSFFLINVIL